MPSSRGPRGGIAVALLLWSGHGAQAVALPWTRLDGAEAARAMVWRRPRWAVRLQPATVSGLLAEAHSLGMVGRGAISTPARGMLAGDPDEDVLAAGGRVEVLPFLEGRSTSSIVARAKGEAALFWQAVDTWKLRAAETRAALHRRRRPVAARVARRSVHPL